MMKEKNTQKTQDLKFLDLMLLIFKNFEEKHQGTPNIKILRSKYKKDSRTLWIFTRTTRTTERTPNLKFLENFNKIFENYKKINNKTPNLKFGTRFNQRKIIFEKDFKKKIPNYQEHRPTL